MTPQEYRQELVNEYFNELNDFYKANREFIINAWEFQGGNVEEWKENPLMKMGFIVKIKTMAENRKGIVIE